MIENYYFVQWQILYTAYSIKFTLIKIFRDEEENGKWRGKRIKNPKCRVNGCGTWRPPMIRNFNYRGKWIPPIINNPNYRGPWKPRMIENPEFIKVSTPYKQLRPYVN